MFKTVAWQCPGWFDVNFGTQKMSGGGHCVATMTSGDVFYLDWACEGGLAGATGTGPLPFGRDNACSGKGTITGGTGSLQGITGSNELQAVSVLFHPDGKGSGVTENTWRIVLP
jgi:hypothetical protein